MKITTEHRWQVTNTFNNTIHANTINQNTMYGDARYGFEHEDDARRALARYMARNPEIKSLELKLVKVYVARRDG